MPALYEQLLEFAAAWESHYKEVQDYEFTIEKGALLPADAQREDERAGNGHPSWKCSNRGILTKEQAINRINSSAAGAVDGATLSPQFKAEALAVGLSGVARCGVRQDRCSMPTRGTARQAGDKVILVRGDETGDIHGFFAAQGILTSRGGKTSHRRVVAPAWANPACRAATRSRSTCASAAPSRLDHPLRRRRHHIDGSTAGLSRAIPTVRPSSLRSCRKY